MGSIGSDKDCKEAEVGGMPTMERIETQLREDEEMLVQAKSEDAAMTKRMEKQDRLKKAWKLTLEQRKFQRMMEMMETLSVLELDMEMEWIETKILEMMDCDVEGGQNVQDELEVRNVTRSCPRWTP
jgi:hypothetical protein